MSLYTASRDENNFLDPLRFWPERWSRKSDTSSSSSSSYLAADSNGSLPFAIGARSCVGKRIADAQIQSTIKLLVERFRITLANADDEIDMVLRMVSVPSHPIHLRISKRD